MQKPQDDGTRVTESSRCWASPCVHIEEVSVPEQARSAPTERQVANHPLSKWLRRLVVAAFWRGISVERFSMAPRPGRASRVSSFSPESQTSRKRQHLPAVNGIYQCRHGDVPGNQSSNKDLPACQGRGTFSEDHEVEQDKRQQQQPEQN